MEPTRRTFLKHSVAGALLSVGGAAHGSYAPTFHPTPPEIEGPFYPVTAQKDKDFDLTRVEGSEGVAKGDPVWIEGTVIDPSGAPIENATVDLWQANAAGRYRHPHDPNPAPLDPNFQGWAVVQTGTEGAFRFKTVLPGSYPAARDWMRPPHIHFKITRRGFVELITQMYFPGHPLNEPDRLLERKGAEERELMFASAKPDSAGTFAFRIVLQPA